MKRSRPFALIAVLAAGVLIAALTGAAKPLPVSQFALTGHWVFNSALQMVFHIDGATTNVDAHAEVPGEAGSQVVQGDTHGYVVGPTMITEFDKATPSVQRNMTPAANEVPVGIEVVGGPYAVYRNAGKVVRLGDPPATVSVGGAVSTPVVTADGTMWLHRQDIGQICTLGKDAGRISACPVTVPAGHPGALTIVDGRPAFVDTFTGSLHVIDGDKLGAGVRLGASVPPNARPATHDLAGRVAILDPQRRSLLLADTRNPPGELVTVALPNGDYDGPVSAGDVVVLVDRHSGTVLTFGPDGTRKDAKPIKQKAGQPRLSRGEDDRVYVEDADGTQVLVVAKEGNVQDVSVAERPAVPSSTLVPPPPSTTTTSRDLRVAAPPVQRQQPTPRRQEQRTPTTPPAVPPSRPGAPVPVSAVAANGSVTVNWGAAPDNRAPITSYRVSWQNGSTTVGGGARSATVNGLTNGTSYVFTVVAINQIGTGPGASAQATPQSPISPPGKPGNLYVRIKTGDTDARVTWSASAPNGAAVTVYHVSWRRDDGSLAGSTDVSGTARSFLIEDLGIQRPFTVTVVAQNSAGRGTPATFHKTEGDQPS
jgi:hypothetical protein